MKKENKLGKFVAFVLLITLVALILVANTYAKYTSSAELSSTATVAKWSIKVSDKDITQNEKVTFDLFGTAKDTDGSDEQDVNKGKIAPGTQGSFDVKIENASEVTAKYTITFESKKSSDIPIEFSVDNGQTWQTDIKTLKLTDTLNAGATSKDNATKISWRWAFERGTESSEKEANDAEDTSYGTASTAPTVIVTAHLVAEQVD